MFNNTPVLTYQFSNLHHPINYCLIRSHKELACEMSGPRRGSSMFTPGGGGRGGMPGGGRGRGSGGGGGRGGGGVGAKRNSVMLQGGGGRGGAPLISGFDFSDDESDDEPQRGPPPQQSYGGRGNGGRGGYPGQSVPGVSSASTGTGGSNARPMVGGFAAAAYEAAKAHHYQSQGRDRKPNSMPQRRSRGHGP